MQNGPFLWGSELGSPFRKRDLAAMFVSSRWNGMHTLPCKKGWMYYLRPPTVHSRTNILHAHNPIARLVAPKSPALKPLKQNQPLFSPAALRESSSVPRSSAPIRLEVLALQKDTSSVAIEHLIFSLNLMGGKMLKTLF